MRIHRLLGLLLPLAALTWAGCDSSAPPVESRWRFVGGTTLSSQTNAPTVRDVMALPESAALRGPLLAHFSRVLWKLASGVRPMPPAALADGLVLVSDLADRLSIGETLAPSPSRREFAIAVQADAARAQVWAKAWPKFFSAAHAARGEKAGEPKVLVRSGWVVAVSDSALLSPEDAFKALSLVPAEPKVVLHAELNLPGRPAAVLDAAVRDGAVRTELKLAFSEALPSKLPAWERPSVIRDPLAKFTAIRGVPAWFGEIPWLKQVAGNDLPKQLFIWSIAGTNAFDKMQTYIAARVENPESWVEHAVAALKPSFTDDPKAAKLSGELAYDPERHAAAINHIFMPPRLAPFRDQDRPYLLLGAMPPTRSSQPFPVGLVAQIERPALLGYDWEITAENMVHWNLVGQVADRLRFRALVNDRPGVRWLYQATTLMGESVTEALVTGPKELTVKRKSTAGFTAMELTWLTRWIDGDAPPRGQSMKVAR